MTFTFDGEPVQAYEGESIAAALMAHGRWSLGRAENQDSARGYFCGMGICFECLVAVEGEGHVRACRRTVSGALVVTRINESSREQ